MLLQLCHDPGSAVQRDNNGKIKTIWLNNDATNPMNQSSKNNRFWKIYWKKLEILSKLQKDRKYYEVW